MMNYDFIERREVDEKLDGNIRSILRSHNLSQNAPSYQKEYFAIEVRKNNTIIGGLTGYSGWDWFYISLLAVSESERGQGLATQLMQKAEEEAIKRNCNGIWLHTISFQAPDFYKKLGYTEFGKIENCPEGHSRLFLIKYLND